MGKFFQDKVCVYLDQFAVSNCAAPDSADEWQRLRVLLEAGVQQQRLVIPYSIEHLLESSLRDAARADAQDAFLFRLSGGLALLPESEITARLLMSAVRERPVGLGTFCRKLSERGFARRRGFQRAGELKRSLNEMLESGAGGINLIRTATAQTPAATQLMQQVTVHLKVQYYQQELLAQLENFARVGTIETKEAAFPQRTIPLWSTALLAQLVSQHRLTRPEAGQIKAAVEQFGLGVAAAPLFVRANLEAAMAFRHQRETPNDALDIQRLSAALPVADIVLTDKAKCFDVKSLRLDKQYRTEVYSGSRTELARFTQRLTELLASNAGLG
jgi:hypothetical protein